MHESRRPYAVTTGVVVRSRRPTDRDDVQDPHERGRSAAAPESAPLTVASVEPNARLVLHARDPRTGDASRYSTPNTS